MGYETESQKIAMRVKMARMALRKVKFTEVSMEGDTEGRP